MNAFFCVGFMSASFSVISYSFFCEYFIGGGMSIFYEKINFILDRLGYVFCSLNS